MDVWGRIRKFVEWTKELFSFSPWARLGLGALIGALGGSSFISFINVYALYNYSIGYNARLPVEGVQYVDVAIAILSFAFLIISFSGAILVFALQQFVSYSLREIFTKAGLSVIAGAIPAISSVITSLGATLSFPYIWPFGGPTATAGPSLSIEVLYVFVGVIILAAISKWPWMVKWVAIFYTLAMILFVCSRLFILENYASFLRKLRYGGGIIVEIYSNQNSRNIPLETGALFLITKSVFIIVNEDSKSFKEIPLTNVSKISYTTDDKYFLPPERGTILGLFEHLWRY